MAQLGYPLWGIKSVMLVKPSKLIKTINFEGLSNVSDFILQGGQPI